MAKAKRPPVTLGRGTCPLCKFTGIIKTNVSDHVYIHCPTPDAGGCGTQIRCQYPKGDALLAKRVTHWTDTAKRKEWLGGGNAPPAPAPEPEAEPEPEPEAEPEPEPEAEPEAEPEIEGRSFWNRPIL